MTEIVDIKEISSTEDVEEAGAAAELVKSEDTIQQQDNANEETEGDEEAPKRYLPDHKKPDAAPTFPEKVGVECRRSISDALFLRTF